MKKYKDAFVFAAAFAVCFLSVRSVGLFNDDMLYKQVSVCSPAVILQFMKWHINFFNGRTLVHLFAMLFLRIKNGLLIWKTVLSLCTAGTCLIISRIARKASRRKTSSLLPVFFLFSVIPYMFTDSLYWLTGSFNYFFPVFLTLLLYLLVLNEKSIFFTAVLSFICGASTEQTGLMCAGMLFLIAADYAVKNRKLRAYHVINLVFCAAGYLTVMLSPGTFNRAESQQGLSVKNILTNLFGILKMNWFSNPYTAVLVFSLSLLFAAVLFKYSRKNAFTRIAGKPLGILTAVSACFQLFFTLFPSLNMRIGLSYSEKLFNTLALICFSVFTLLFILSAAVCTVNIYIYEKEVLPAVCICLAAGSQLIMAAAQSVILRAAVPAVFWLILLASYLISITVGEKVTDKKSVRVIFTCVTLLVCVSHIFLSSMNVMASNDREVLPLDRQQMEEYISKTQKTYREYYSGESWNKEYDLSDFTHTHKF